MEHYGKIDILVNSAGIPCRNVAETQSYEDWMLVMDSDLNGPFWLMHECVRLSMKERRYGKIINVASIHAFVSRLGYNTNAYCAAKGGLLMLTKSLAQEWAKYNITVNGIAPGYFPSELTGAYIDTPAFKKKCVRIIALWVGLASPVRWMVFVFIWPLTPPALPQVR